MGCPKLVFLSHFDDFHLKQIYNVLVNEVQLQLIKWRKKSIQDFFIDNYLFFTWRNSQEQIQTLYIDSNRNVYIFTLFGYFCHLAHFQRYHLWHLHIFCNAKSQWTFYFWFSIETLSERRVISEQIIWISFILVNGCSLGTKVYIIIEILIKKKVVESETWDRV